VAHRFAGFLGVVLRLEFRTEPTVSATGTVVFSDEKLGRYLPNWVGRMKRSSVTYMKDISDMFKRRTLGWSYREKLRSPLMMTKPERIS
jgi:hypothetical protein